MKRSIDTIPLVVLHAKPQLVKNKHLNRQMHITVRMSYKKKTYTMFVHGLNYLVVESLTSFQAFL